ncbi:MAG TPA: hypothetical protein VF271_00130 [Rhodanobacteraceae bacterium]
MIGALQREISVNARKVKQACTNDLPSTAVVAAHLNLAMPCDVMQVFTIAKSRRQSGTWCIQYEEIDDMGYPLFTRLQRDLAVENSV